MTRKLIIEYGAYTPATSGPARPPTELHELERGLDAEPEPSSMTTPREPWSMWHAGWVLVGVIVLAAVVVWLKP